MILMAAGGMDNGSSHRGEASVRRLTQAHPRLVPVHGPVHASWLNQIEIYFSIVQRKVLTPNDFPCLEARRAAGEFRALLRKHRASVRMEVHPRGSQCTRRAHAQSMVAGSAPEA
ncbi:MAG TPA: transposase, partial [Burkholderiaceae bacterium]